MSTGGDGPTFIQALALGLDPAWRRQPDTARAADAAAFEVAESGAANARSLINI
jgi:hypothetical protein